ncbi:hypothetical protein [Cupriavidus necator]|uniref:hypothetical protein n=1 Tax=Cupriavidus necator TaxID=106590 RepID=UPI0012D2AA99|nr:hypothetical protein [Cupriavidus necator]
MPTSTLFGVSFGTKLYDKCSDGRNKVKRVGCNATPTRNSGLINNRINLQEKDDYPWVASTDAWLDSVKQDVRFTDKHLGRTK